MYNFQLHPCVHYNPHSSVMVDNGANTDTIIFTQNDSGTPHVHTQQNTNPPQ